MYTDLKTLCISSQTRLRDAIAQMDVSRIGIVLVVDSHRRLLGTITDGDVRRGILANIDLGGPADVLLQGKSESRFAQPISAPADADRATLWRTLQDNDIAHLPLVDQEQRVVALATRNDFVPDQESAIQAVIMAGGLGKRLRPLTENLPKPMLPVGDKPLMERVVEQLRVAGMCRVNVTTHYQPEAITQHFGDGKRFGVEIQYVKEEQPLGTAGAIGLLRVTDEPLLVINGDVLTRMDFRAMLDFHREQGADMTVAVRQHEFQLPYGVVETNGVDITTIAEKPAVKHLIIAGIYLLSPGTCQNIPTGLPLDMPELIAKLVAEERKVVSFPIHEYWLDIGQHADYQQAQTDFAEGSAT